MLRVPRREDTGAELGGAAALAFDLLFKRFFSLSGVGATIELALFGGSSVIRRGEDFLSDAFAVSTGGGEVELLIDSFWSVVFLFFRLDPATMINVSMKCRAYKLHIALTTIRLFSKGDQYFKLFQCFGDVSEELYKLK